MIVVQTVGGLLFAASSAYLFLAILRVTAFRERVISPVQAPAVSLLIPCHGAPPRLYECLRSVVNQDYPGPLQVIFGLHCPDDPARAVIDRLLGDFPRVEAQVVVDTSRPGANPKNCNLANMYPAARHDVLVVVDSDVLVKRSFLATIVAPLDDPKTGCVTCVYKGLPGSDLASQLGALYVNDYFIPSVLVDLARHDMDITYGAAAAMRRDALDGIGGFVGMADAVAQDYVLGHSMRAAGWRVALAPEVVATTVSEAGFRGLYRHEVRWMRAIRAVRPKDHLLWILTTALVPLCLLAPAFPAAVALPALAVYFSLRCAVHILIRRHVDLAPAGLWLLPLREVLNFALWAGSFLDRRIRWDGKVLVTGDGLTMKADRPHNCWTFGGST